MTDLLLAALCRRWRGTALPVPFFNTLGRFCDSPDERRPDPDRLMRGRTSRPAWTLPGTEWHEIRPHVVPFVTAVSVLVKEMATVPEDDVLPVG
jgi:hypothetical protein